MGTCETRGGTILPVLGQGTWAMGEDPARRREEVAALRLGLDLGLTLVDTAEMYADGGAEEVVGEAIDGRREGVFLVSKVLPHNASREATVRACEGSLRRLGTEILDLYLLHWPGDHPLEETLDAFLSLREAGKIRAFGVSNFDPKQMRGAVGLAGGDEIAVNQILYNLRRRGPERKLIPWCRDRRIATMAYSPLEQGRLASPALESVARRRGVTAEQVALAWVLRLESVVAIPKAADRQHVRANAAAASLELTRDDLAELDRAFPSPVKDGPLETS
jgi:diketogulonate reductase-like aldo/keto reductase